MEYVVDKNQQTAVKLRVSRSFNLFHRNYPFIPPDGSVGRNAKTILPEKRKRSQSLTPQKGKKKKLLEFFAVAIWQQRYKLHFAIATLWRQNAMNQKY
jgi:hypothetical protein